MICILKFFVSIHFGLEIYFLTEVFCHATKLWVCPFPGAGHTWKEYSLFSRIPFSSEERVVNEGHVLLLLCHMNSQSHRARLWKRPRLVHSFHWTWASWDSTAAALTALPLPFPHWSLFCHHFLPFSSGKWISPDKEGERKVEFLSL